MENKECMKLTSHLGNITKTMRVSKKLDSEAIADCQYELDRSVAKEFLKDELKSLEEAVAYLAIET